MTQIAPLRRGSPQYILALLFATYALNIADRTLLGIVIDPVGRDLVLSDTQLSIVSGFAFVAFNLGVGVLIANWIDRGNRKNILLGGIALWSAATALTGLAQGFGSLLLCRILIGVGEATAFPVALSMISDLFAPERRPRAVSIFQVSTFVGIVGGAVLAGILAAAHGWRMMFMICGSAGFVLVAIIVFTMREPVRGRFDKADTKLESTTSIVASIRAVLSQPGYLPLAIGFGLASMATGVMPTWGPAFFLRSHGVPLEQVGALLGPMIGIGGLIGTLGAGFLATTLVRRSGNQASALLVPLFALPLAVPTFAIMLASPGVPGMLAANLVSNLLLASHLGPCVALGVSMAATNMRGIASTLLLVSQGLIGSALAPLIVGVVSDALTPALGAEALRYAMATMVIAPGLGAAFLWVAYRKIRRRADAMA